ncbi:MAG TPA: SRPBCC domain-containing protein [Jatrophihabitans sp.]|nr:SRPBCC domain-containing protein [Jatrophihabitans sp.]
MTFGRDLLVHSDPENCWAIVTDVPRLVGWVTILHEAKELTALEHYEAVLMDRMGPFKLRADLDIKVSEVEIGRRIRVRASGEDRQVSSRIGVDATLTLEPQPDGQTMIRATGSYEVVGRVASLGAGMIKQKATKIIDEFFVHAASELGG